MYSDTGGDGPVVVVLHGVLMHSTQWDTVVDRLRDRYRCIVQELPFGAHTTPTPDDADLSLPALATLIAELPRGAEGLAAPHEASPAGGSSPVMRSGVAGAQ